MECSEVGRVTTLHWMIDFLEEWLGETGTDPAVCGCIVLYARGRGYMSMHNICRSLDSRFHDMAVDQDIIGPRRFMEGIIPSSLVCLQADFRALTGEGPVALSWASQLVVRLLELTHGQWVYRNILVHNETQGTLRTMEKERLQCEIEREMNHEFKGFLGMDRSRANVTLEDLEIGGREQQEYWLLAVKAAWVVKTLVDSNSVVDTQPD